jgi:hypothetical protein
MIHFRQRNAPKQERPQRIAMFGGTRLRHLAIMNHIMRLDRDANMATSLSASFDNITT